MFVHLKNNEADPRAMEILRMSIDFEHRSLVLLWKFSQECRRRLGAVKLPPMTPLQKNILAQYISTGKNEVCRINNISRRGLYNTLTILRKKFKCRTNNQLVSLALRGGLEEARAYDLIPRAKSQYDPRRRIKNQFSHWVWNKSPKAMPLAA